MFYDLHPAASLGRFHDLLSLSSAPTRNRWVSHESYKDGLLTIDVDMPGFKEDDLDIEVADHVLTIKGSSDQRGHYLVSYRLQRSLDTTKMEAVLDSGVLTVTIPQAEEAQPKKISIRTADRLPPPQE